MEFNKSILYTIKTIVFTSYIKKKKILNFEIAKIYPYLFVIIFAKIFLKNMNYKNQLRQIVIYKFHYDSRRRSMYYLCIVFIYFLTIIFFEYYNQISNKNWIIWLYAMLVEKQHMYATCVYFCFIDTSDQIKINLITA